jgi:hypothetical protein
MFLIVVAGLGAASLLYRVVMAAARRRQSSNDYLEADSIGDQNARDNQQQYRSVDERDQLVDDLHPSTIAGANVGDDQQHHRSVDEGDQFSDDLQRLSAANGRDDQQHDRSVDKGNQFIDDFHRLLVSGANNYEARRPHPVDDEWPNEVRRTGCASQITDDMSARESTLAQLRQDLDRLLHDKSREDQLQRRPIDEPEPVIDDLHRAPISGANDDDAPPPHRADDQWPNNGRRAGGASQITDEVSEREGRLTQWRRDLDLLLQPRKSA